MKLSAYLGQELNILKVASVTVQYKDQVESIPLAVVEGNGPSLLR